MTARPNLTSTSQVLILTGAGVSAESGVPTFRGVNGLWEGRRVEEVASPEGFDADPQLVWRFYSLRRDGAAKVNPNPGHEAIARLEGALGERLLLVTQNVDGLHARAGSTRVMCLHGELFKTRCERCNVPFADTRTYFDGVPRCSTCDNRLRPHIVWFGELLSSAHLRQVDDFIERAGRELIFFAIGTSGQVYPAAGFVDAARHAGGQCWLVDVDPPAEYARRFDHVVKGRSGEVLPALFGV
ncbi:MAG: NAD-dependent deacylase [Myxococcus sp.]|nr:NAD-dependent deacylase [Myxococcus sp.]